MTKAKILILGILVSTLLNACGSAPAACENCIQSLQTLSVESLKQRRYGSALEWVPNTHTDGQFLSYLSDGLRLYSRVILPTTAAPSNGYPIVIYAHGWVGLEQAPSYDFGRRSGSLSHTTIDQMRAAGFAVLVPGYRGHGTVQGIAADGIESMAAWDNASYLSPILYAIDTLNLIDSLDTLQQLPWPTQQIQPSFDLNAVHIIGHSQGGDVALTALAISGEGSQLKHPIQSGALISGCFPDRFTQVQSYRPMQESLQAFMSGDGTWTGSAVGKKGEINPYFVFPYPGDWIDTVDTTSPDWTWQADTWTQVSVNDVVLNKYQEMYRIYNQQIMDLSKLEFQVVSKPEETLRLQHDPRLPAALKKIGAYHSEHYLSEPVAFHYSDRDFYSFPEWNKSLSERINQQGGQSYHFPYPGNTHTLQLSTQRWFSPTGSQVGLMDANRRNIELFMGRKPQ